MELEQINAIERATRYGRAEVFRVGLAVMFLAGIMLYVRSIGADTPNLVMLVVAAMIGGYMAMNIGANDVANNVGPAVGSKALTLAGAIAIAAIFEASGALIAGGDVVSTIKKGIIDPALIGDPDTFIWLMMAALLAAALSLYLIKRRITYKRDIAQAARKNVPIFVAIMAWVFATYLLISCSRSSPLG